MGALVAIVVLWVAFLMMKSRADAWFAGAIDPASLIFLSLSVIVALLAAGMAVGSIGGLIAAQSTREIHD